MPIVQRLLNWSADQEYITRNPIAGTRKPRRIRRDVFYTSEQWKAIRSHANPALGNLLDILDWTGCRPIEARAIESRHLRDDLVIFPAEESKGTSDPRVIFPIPEARALLESKLDKHAAGPLLRNTRERPWTKDSIKCALTRISDAVGFRVIAYGVRHSFATNALTRGGVDPISVAHLMGHKDTSMVSRVYSHIAKNPDFLRCQVKKAADSLVVGAYEEVDEPTNNAPAKKKRKKALSQHARHSQSATLFDCRLHVYRWEDDDWSEVRCAVAENPIVGDRNLAQSQVFAVAPRDSNRASQLVPQQPLAGDRFLIKPYIDRLNKTQSDRDYVLGEEEFYGQIEVNQEWNPGDDPPLIIHAPPTVESNN